MASRYASFTRCARSAMHQSSRRGSSSNFRPSNPKPTSFTNPNSASTRRRWAMSLIPLHNAVADAKLVSHLSVTSRNCSALALGLQGFIDAELHTFGVRSPQANRALSLCLTKPSRIHTQASVAMSLSDLPEPNESFQSSSRTIRFFPNCHDYYQISTC